jgi:predicted nucleic acid-binding protein
MISWNNAKISIVTNWQSTWEWCLFTDDKKCTRCDNHDNNHKVMHTSHKMVPELAQHQTHAHMHKHTHTEVLQLLNKHTLTRVKATLKTTILCRDSKSEQWTALSISGKDKHIHQHNLKKELLPFVNKTRKM